MQFIEAGVKGVIAKRARMRSNEGSSTRAATIGMALGAALLFAFSAAHAAPSALAKACAKDVKSVCGDVKPGGGKLAACMKEHFSDLSTDCQIAYVKVAAVGRACRRT